jgi:hypothetical protein
MSVELPPPHIVQQTLPHIISFLGMLARGIVTTPNYQALRASSWWRDVETNRRVGGHPDSQHLLGLALDVTGPPEVLQDFLVASRLQGLVALDEGTHAHLQLFPAGTPRDAGLFA